MVVEDKNLIFISECFLLCFSSKFLRQELCSTFFHKVIDWCYYYSKAPDPKVRPLVKDREKPVWIRQQPRKKRNKKGVCACVPFCRKAFWRLMRKKIQLTLARLFLPVTSSRGSIRLLSLRSRIFHSSLSLLWPKSHIVYLGGLQASYLPGNHNTIKTSSWLGEMEEYKLVDVSSLDGYTHTKKELKKFSCYLRRSSDSGLLSSTFHFFISESPP